MKAGFQVEIADLTPAPRSLASALALRADGRTGAVIDGTRGALKAGAFKRPGTPPAAPDPQREAQRKKIALEEALKHLLPKLQRYVNKPFRALLTELKRKAENRKQKDIIEGLGDVEEKLMGHLEGLLLNFDTLFRLVESEVLRIADIELLTDC